MTLRSLALLLFGAALPFAVFSEPESPTFLGYSAQGAGVQRGWERKFRDGVAPDNIREYMRRLTARPHHVGSAYDKDNGEWILAKFKEWGFDARIETFNVLFPTPKVRVLEMLKPSVFHAALREPAVPQDPTSDQVGEQLPTEDLYKVVVGIISHAMQLGFQLAAPFLVFGFAVYAGLGVLAKLMPQLQIFFVAVPINIACGFLIFLAMLGAMMTIFLNFYSSQMAVFL